MTKIIDFRNLGKTPRKEKPHAEVVERSSGKNNDHAGTENGDGVSEINENIDLILNTRPGRIIFSIKESAEILGFSMEFVRRRVKNNTIKAIDMGDRQMIHIKELARILTTGV